MARRVDSLSGAGIQQTVEKRKSYLLANPVLGRKKLFRFLRIPMLIVFFVVLTMKEGLSFFFLSAGDNPNQFPPFSLSSSGQGSTDPMGHNPNQKKQANTFDLQIRYGFFFQLGFDFNDYLESMNELMSEEKDYYTQVNGSYDSLRFGHNYEIELYVKLRPSFGLTLGVGRIGGSMESKVKGTIIDVLSFDDALSMSYDLNCLEFGFKTDLPKALEKLFPAGPFRMQMFLKAFLGYYQGRFWIKDYFVDDLESSRLTFDAPIRNFGGGIGIDVIFGVSKTIGIVFSSMGRFFWPSDLTGDYRLAGMTSDGPFEDGGIGTAWLIKDSGYSWLLISPRDPSLEDGMGTVAKMSPLPLMSFSASFGLAFRF